MIANSDDLETIHEILYQRAGVYYNMEALGKIAEAIATLRVVLEQRYQSFAHIENDNEMKKMYSGVYSVLAL